MTHEIREKRILQAMSETQTTRIVNVNADLLAACEAMLVHWSHWSDEYLKERAEFHGAWSLHGDQFRAVLAMRAAVAKAKAKGQQP